jgi:hypothetical protein
MVAVAIMAGVSVVATMGGGHRRRSHGDVAVATVLAVFGTLRSESVVLGRTRGRRGGHEVLL